MSNITARRFFPVSQVRVCLAIQEGSWGTPKMFGWDSMECEVRNVKIYYEIHGDGTPVLMIHGRGVDHRLMKGCM